MPTTRSQSSAPSGSSGDQNTNNEGDQAGQSGQSRTDRTTITIRMIEPIPTWTGVKLRRGESNWDTWCMEMENVFSKYHAAGYITGDEPKPAEGYADAEYTWRSNHSALCAFLLETIDKKDMKNFHKIKRVDILWNALRNTYNKSGTSSKVE